VTLQASATRKPAAPASDPTSPPVRVTIDTDPARILSRLTSTPSAASGAASGSPIWYRLLLAAQKLRPAATFDTLLAPAVLNDRVRPLEYQARTVRRVLRELAPAAILADEVGLGKTIEAGLIYKELALRGMIRSTLVLAPKALLGQWQGELRERFESDFVLTDESRFRGFPEESQVICSLQQFVRSFDRVNARPWDLLIVDEAHLLANLDSKRRRSVAELSTRWRLLLTATPISNKLTDLFSLVDLAVPGRLGTPREFELDYVADRGTARVVRPERADQLRAIAAGVMCRTRRSETEIAFAGRVVSTRSVTPSPEEDALIDDVTAYLRSLYRRLPPARAAQTRESGAPASPATPKTLNRGAMIREIMALQQSLSSSPSAIEDSLRRRAETHPDERDLLLALADRCGTVSSAKESLLQQTLTELGREPVLIFTLRLETATRLRAVACAAGRTAECYVGALSRGERERLVERFNGGNLDVLIATDAGAEGLNLQQRCSVVVNYDLHWNPMRIEQRIGRVHRLGQKREVSVYNYAVRDTIDDYVLQLLYQKINLFTLAIGAIETILADEQDAEIDLEERILETLLRAPNKQATQSELRALGDDLLLSSGRQHDAEYLTAEVLG
jgi:SNF2 family DNA or RNA helicase